MRFQQFIEKHKELMPKVKHEMDIDNPAIRILSRVWNAFAILNPEMCEDVVMWDMNDQAPHLAPNPYVAKKVKREKQSERADNQATQEPAPDHVEQ